MNLQPFIDINKNEEFLINETKEPINHNYLEVPELRPDNQKPNEEPYSKRNSILLSISKTEQNPSKSIMGERASSLTRDISNLIPGDEMGAVFDYAFYCYKFFQNLLFGQAITFVIFCQFTQDYFNTMMEKWTFECQSKFWLITGIQYSIAILTIFCFFQKYEAISH